MLFQYLYFQPDQEMHIYWETGKWRKKKLTKHFSKFCIGSGFAWVLSNILDWFVLYSNLVTPISREEVCLLWSWITCKNCWHAVNRPRGGFQWQDSEIYFWKCKHFVKGKYCILPHRNSMLVKFSTGLLHPIQHIHPLSTPFSIFSPCLLLLTFPLSLPLSPLITTAYSLFPLSSSQLLPSLSHPQLFTVKCFTSLNCCLFAFCFCTFSVLFSLFLLHPSFFARLELKWHVNDTVPEESG